ncbi:MAG: cation-translocating P-type ATPase [Bacillus sp. (in: firmicutes)]
MLEQHAKTENSTQSSGNAVDARGIVGLHPESVYDYLDVTERGLSEKEAQSRLRIYGDNTIKSKKSFHPVKVFALKFVNVMAIMLWVASVLALISGTPLLSYVIWAIIFLNAVFSFIQESKADKALQALAKMIPNNVKVRRNDEIVVKTAEQLVPGDVVSLRAGDKVPADIRIVSSNNLFVDNSMLTGESVPVDRDAYSDNLHGESIVNSRNLLFAGTAITSGDAIGVVFAIGRNTQIGNITQTTAAITKGKSSLEIQIQRITKVLSAIAVILGVLAFSISLFVSNFEVNEALIFAIGIIVANIPEGLMPTVSLSLSLSVQRMAKKNALVRKQSAVETLSSTTVICTDKTGTLTQNKMFAKKIWTFDGLVDISGQGYDKKGVLTGVNEKNKETLQRLFTATAVCSDTIIRTDREDEQKWKIIGNPTEAALLIAAQKFGLDVLQLKDQFERTKVIPFSSETKTMSVLGVNQKNADFGEKQLVQFTKGDPVKVVDYCRYMFKEGKVVEATSEDKSKIRAVNNKMAKEGYRLLAIAYTEQVKGNETVTDDLIFLGLAVMYDPPKEGVRKAVEDCYRAGIKVTVVTGDYSLTAAAIAKQVGIVQDQYVAITGAELEQMTKQQLAQKLDTDLPVIFARTTPKDKLKIVETYQSLGHVVAATGDGINDVLALRKADIGISMGKDGSDAAIESSDVVLLDDHFATIVEAVKEGRAIYSNIQKFITYILASNIPEIIPFILMGILNIPLALTVVLVLAIDLGTDILPAISLGEEEPDDNILDYPPRKRESNILDRNVLLRSYTFLGMIEAALLFVMFFFTWNHFGYTFAEVRSFTQSIIEGTASEQITYVYQYAITLAFGSVIACQMGNVFVCRSKRQSMFKLFKKKNHLLLWGLGIELCLFLLIAYMPLMQTLFGTTGPKLQHVAMLVMCPFILILFEETRKWLVRRNGKVATL